MAELKTKEEKIGEYIYRVDGFLKYYETWFRFIKKKNW